MEKRVLEKQIRLPLDELKLAVKKRECRKPDEPYYEVYERMSKAGAIENYIIPYYDTLHTESREYVIDDVMEYIENKERDTKC